MLAVGGRSLPHKRCPANIAPGEEHHAARHEQQAQAEQHKRSRRCISKTRDHWPVEVVIIERREVLQPAPIDLPPSDVQKQSQEQQAAGPARRCTPADRELGEQQRHHAKEEGQQAQVQPRQQRPDQVGMLLNPGFTGHSTQREEHRDQQQREHERTNLLQQQACTCLWRGQQDIHRAAFLFPAHQVCSDQNGPEAEQEWQGGFHVAKGDIPRGCLHSDGLAEKANERRDTSKGRKHRRCSRRETHKHEQGQAYAPGQDGHAVISERFAPNAAKHSITPYLASAEGSCSGS